MAAELSYYNGDLDIGVSFDKSDECLDACKSILSQWGDNWVFAVNKHGLLFHVPTESLYYYACAVRIMTLAATHLFVNQEDFDSWTSQGKKGWPVALDDVGIRIYNMRDSDLCSSFLPS